MSHSLDRKYNWLIERITRTNPTFEEISDSWEVSELNDTKQKLSKRTFIYWKTQILSIYGIDIKYERLGREYRYKIDEKPGERRVSDWLTRTMGIHNTIADNISIRDRIVLEDVPSGDAYLQDILLAIKENLCISFTYNDYWEDSIQVTIKPYFVHLFHQMWHVIGPMLPQEPARKKERSVSMPATDEYDTIKSYSLEPSRMVDFKITDIRFKYPENFCPASFYENNMGTLTEPLHKRPVTTVRLLVWGKQNFYIRNNPLHHSQQEDYHEGDGYSIFTYRIQPTYDFMMAIQACGSDIEVLSPGWFRREMIQEARDVLDGYEGSRRVWCKRPIDIDQ